MRVRFKGNKKHMIHDNDQRMESSCCIIENEVCSWRNDAPIIYKRHTRGRRPASLAASALSVSLPYVGLSTLCTCIGKKIK